MPSGGKKHVELQRKGLCSPPHLSLRRVGGIWSRKISPGGGGASWVPTDGWDRGSALFILHGPERQMDSEGAVREGWRP